MEFKFEIGEIVYHVTAINHAFNAAAFGALDLPEPLIVTERMAQECPGGVQRSYLVTGAGKAGLRFNEIELVRPNAYRVGDLMTAWIAGRAEVRRREIEAKLRWEVKDSPEQKE